MGPRRPGRPGHGRAGLPARGCRRRQPVGRRAPPRRHVQAAAREARDAAARRAHQPSRRRDRVLAGGAPARLSGRDPDRDPRPLLPRQRHGLDPGARPRPGHPLRGQLLDLAEAEAEAPAAGGPRGRGAPARAGAGERVDRLLAQGPPVQVQGPRAALRGPLAKSEERVPSITQIVIPVAERLGQQRHRRREPEEGLRRAPADRRPVVQAAAGRHRGHHRAERRRQDHAVPHDHRPGDARLRHDQARRLGRASATSTSRATRSTRRRTSGRRSPTARR